MHFDINDISQIPNQALLFSSLAPLTLTKIGNTLIDLVLISVYIFFVPPYHSVLAYVVHAHSKFLTS